MTFQEWYDNLLPEDFQIGCTEELLQQKENYFDTLAAERLEGDWWDDAC